MSSGGEYIPVAPLECCGLCLGDKIHDKTNCEDLNFCSNNGICTLGACECFEGYAGALASFNTWESCVSLQCSQYQVCVLAGCGPMQALTAACGRAAARRPARYRGGARC